MASRAKRTVLLESEGKILRLEVDQDAPPHSTAASVRIFVEQSGMSLDVADVERMREALGEPAATKGRA